MIHLGKDNVVQLIQGAVDYANFLRALYKARADVQSDLQKIQADIDGLEMVVEKARRMKFPDAVRYIATELSDYGIDDATLRHAEKHLGYMRKQAPKTGQLEAQQTGAPVKSAEALDIVERTKALKQLEELRAKHKPPYTTPIGRKREYEGNLGDAVRDYVRVRSRQLVFDPVETAKHFNVPPAPVYQVYRSIPYLREKKLKKTIRWKNEVC